MDDDVTFTDVEIDGSDPIPACIACGVLIADPDRHRRWHQDLGSAEAQRQMLAFKQRRGGTRLWASRG